MERLRPRALSCKVENVSWRALFRLDTGMDMVFDVFLCEAMKELGFVTSGSGLGATSSVVKKYFARHRPILCRQFWNKIILND